MLATYLQRIQRMLGDTRFERYNPYDLIAYVNEARQQVAVEGECVRETGTLSTVYNINTYPNSAISVPAGASGVLEVFSITQTNRTPANPLLLEDRPWEWFNLYFLTMGQPPPGQPAAWSQYSQGVGGVFYIAPLPNGVYTLALDAICLPAPLRLDSDPELIPFPWTDAVAYYAGHLALRGEGVMDGADEMLNLYETYMVRARAGVTPRVIPSSYPGGVQSRRMQGQAPVGPAEIAQPPQPGGRQR